MRKFFLSLIGVLLLSTTAFGSDVLFKMEMLHTSSVSTAASSSTDLGAYAIVFGGTAEVVNPTNDSRNIIAYASDTSYITINSGGYIHIVLDRALAVGDKILYTEYKTGSSGHTILATRANSRSRYNNDRNTLSAGTEFAVPQATDELVGATELWIWYDTNNTMCIKSLTITRTNVNPLATEYLFNGEDGGVIGEASSTNTLKNGLVVNNDDSKNNKIDTLAGSKVLYLAGAGSNRVAMFNVTDPCTIEIWGRSSSSEGRTVYIAEGSFKSTSNSTAVTGLSSVARSQLYKGTYNYTGVEDNKTIYVQVNGGFHIAAIRVVYNRIRPAADLTADVLTTVLQKRNNITITASSSSDQTITRSNVSGTELVNVTGATGTTYTISAKSPVDNPDLGTYVMRLSQPASAYYRASSIVISIRIVNDGESVSDVAWNSSYVSTTSYVWKNDENVTLIQNTNDTKFDNNHEAIGEFAAGTGLRLATGRNYTLSVPSNKQIARVTFSGYTAQIGTGSITPNGGSPTAFNEKTAENDGDIKHISYDNINAQSFSFAVSGKNIIVKIDLVTTDLGYYPVTFGSNWASFCAPEDVELPEGVYAYIASSNDEETITVNKVEGNKVPANEGVLLYSESLASCHVTATTDAPALDGNILQYTTARTARPASGTTYALNGDEGCFQEYTGNYIPANKAYVHIPAAEPGSAPKRLRLVVEGTNTATGMEAISGQSVISRKVVEDGQLVIIRDGVKYNVQGQIIK